MIEKIRVKINNAGTRAREINPFGQFHPLGKQRDIVKQHFNGNKYVSIGTGEYFHEADEEHVKQWQWAENKLREFEIIMVNNKPYPYMKLGIKFWHLLPHSIHTAEVVNENKIKITY